MKAAIAFTLKYLNGRRSVTVVDRAASILVGEDGSVDSLFLFLIASLPLLLVNR